MEEDALITYILIEESEENVMKNLKLNKEKAKIRDVKIKFLKDNIIIQPAISAILLAGYVSNMFDRYLLIETGCNDINWLKENYKKVTIEQKLNNFREIDFRKGILLQSDNITDGYEYDITLINIVNDMYDELFGTFEWAH